MSRRTKTMLVEVEVELDMGTLDTAELITEVEARGHTVASPNDPLDEQIVSGVSAYLSGCPDALREWARNFLQDRAYKVLP